MLRLILVDQISTYVSLRVDSTNGTLAPYTVLLAIFQYKEPRTVTVTKKGVGVVNSGAGVKLLTITVFENMGALYTI